MILVDTSVLIDFFRKDTNDPVLKFRQILDRKMPFGINAVIFQEILQGAKSENEYNLLKCF
jgi:predicted nucleic acid-binding protein